MKLIFFTHQDASEKGANLKRVMNQNLIDTDIQFFHTFNSFKERLKRISVYEKEIYVLLADSKNRLKEINQLIDLLEDKRIILILPDASKTNLSMAHHLYPRFLTYINNTYDDLCAVLIKMINREKLNNKGDKEK
jgi:hypothetical protein